MIKFRSNVINENTHDEYIRYENVCSNCSRVKIGSFKGLVGQFRLNTMKSMYFDEFVEAISLDRNIEATSIQHFAPKHLARISQRHKILRHQVMDYVFENRSSTIYILDSGVCPNCSEFGNRVVSKDTFEKGEPSEHGTEVASVAGGETLGAAKSSILADFKVLNSDGIGTMSNVLFALQEIMKNEVVGVILLPFIGRRNFILESAVSEMVEAGFVVVASAGNSGSDACFFSPSGSSSVITVGSIDATTDELAPFSNYGPCVNLYADGVQLETMTTNGSLSMQSGTSFSAALVAGVVSTLLTSNSTGNIYWNGVTTDIQTPNGARTNTLRQTGSDAHILSYLARKNREDDVKLKIKSAEERMER